MTEIAEKAKPLTKRQLQVLFLAAGVDSDSGPMSNGEIARELGITENRVKSLNTETFKRMGMLVGQKPSNMTEAVVLALKHGIIPKEKFYDHVIQPLSMPLILGLLKELEIHYPAA